MQWYAQFCFYYLIICMVPTLVEVCQFVIRFKKKYQLHPNF